MRQENLASLGSSKEGLAAASGGKFCGKEKDRFNLFFCPSPGQGNTFCLDTKSIQKSPCFIEAICRTILPTQGNCRAG
ncbi:hypothetical protein PQ465_13350 [Sphingobacterium oryzagri]|uniref:Uncharacterized protein n=1 Tax=Sphingobacterium oryzagri TaxID=3025669 RepID=A0ABY7WEH8_9SPHI|nr:hypothetical protein [Sphingobacterium sp. KACC 22765]WDF67290.1 hypothetical protein PQ465_13350 [Sphingobacterium sp. KACC 22765]